MSKYRIDSSSGCCRCFWLGWFVRIAAGGIVVAVGFIRFVTGVIVAVGCHCCSIIVVVAVVVASDVAVAVVMVIAAAANSDGCCWLGVT